MTQETNLKPCPFCGGEADVESETCGWRVKCIERNCYTAGPWPDDCTEAEAVAAWNTRAFTEAAQQSVPNSVVEAIQKIIDHYSIAGANLLCWLDAEDLEKMPRPSGRPAGVPWNMPTATDWQNWASDVACRKFFEALEKAKQAASLTTLQQSGQTEAADAWRPIETAPRDGTRVIVASINWVYSREALNAARLDEIKDEYRVWWVSQGQFDAEKDRWHDGLENLVPPTHWQPLLTPSPHVGPQGCRVPPDGWYCTRKEGHDGPCAALATATHLKGASHDDQD